MNRHAAPRPACTVAGCLLVLLAQAARAAEQAPPHAKLLDAFTARPIGPANMGGRIVDVAVVESAPATMYVATASGGLWKTTDNGDSWTPVFDHQTSICIGDVAVSPSNPDVVWVGTGEANARNSVAWGDGVYKSADGGKTWTNMGLKETHHVGRIVIHPKNPDVVYVAAVGHFWAPNKERGLYKTTDGGKTWQLSKYLNEETGFIDVAMDPEDPEVLYACAYRVRRDGFSGGNPAVQTGPEAGLYKTADGGKTWAKLTKGLPENPCGRCGVDVYRKDPKVVYAVIQTDKTATSVQGQQAGNSDKVETGGVFRSDDKGQTWTKVNDLCPRPFYYGQIRIDPSDDQRVYVLGVSFHVSGDGGKKFTAGRGGAHPDHHALWIDPKDSNHLILGNDGGLYFSKNKGGSWEAVRNLPIGQFYAVAVDMRKPYRVYGGLQDNGSWGGPSATPRADGITLNDWRRVAGADGFYCQVDPTDPNTVYAEGQYGNLQRVDVSGAQARSKNIKPRPEAGKPAYRFNWNSPVLLSPHDPKTVYFGGNHLFRSADRGDKWEVISADLTRGRPGPDPTTGHTITTIAESPLKAGLLYVGTDDGRLHVTRDGGKEWADLSDKVPGLPPDRWITRVECSSFDEGTAFLAVSRYRNDDLKPYVFKTTDHGLTWKPLVNGLPPEGPVHVVRQSSRSKDLLFAGTEFGLFVSLDGGGRWERFRAGLPTVAVHDLVIHPRDRDLVIGTHGRSVYVMDIAPLEELSAKVLAADVHLFDVKPALAFEVKEAGPTGTTAKAYKAPNPPFGARIAYHLKAAAGGPVTVTIFDAANKPVATLQGPKDAGLQAVTWNLRPEGDAKAALVKPGEYLARLKVGDKELTKKVKVEAAE